MPLDRLRGEKYGKILCYPRFDSEELEKRLEELKRLGVTALEFTGEKKVADLTVLGKGCVGIVVKAYADKGIVALKIRRVDAGRSGMQHEAEMLERANAVNVGPKLLNVTENFLLMEFIEGQLVPEWLERKTRQTVIRRVLRDLLEQCWRLDEAGVDHGELSRAPKHIIVDADDNPRILDFETASVTRRVSNVTSICQFLFIGSQTAKTITRKFGKVDTEELVKVLRGYKERRTRENFSMILSVCKLS